MNKDLCYTTIHHGIRRQLWVNLIEYTILDSVARTQKNWYSSMSKEYLANWIWISERSVYDYIKVLMNKWMLSKSERWWKLMVTEEIKEVLLFWNPAKSAVSESESMQNLQSNPAKSADNNNIYNKTNNINIISKEIKISIKEKIKNEIEKRWKLFNANHKMDFILIWHLLNNKDFNSIMEKYNFSREQLIEKIFTLFDKDDFYKNNFYPDNINSFYRNWTKVINRSKTINLNKPTPKIDLKEALDNF